MDASGERLALEYARAMQCLKDGLAILDENSAPADIGAHIDLAICRLEAHLTEAQLSSKTVAA